MIESINNLNQSLGRKLENIGDELLSFVDACLGLIMTLIKIITMITCILAVVYFILCIICAIVQTLVWLYEKNNDLGKYCWHFTNKCTFSDCRQNPGCDYSKLKVILSVLDKFINNLFGTADIKRFELVWDNIQRAYYNPR